MTPSAAATRLRDHLARSLPDFMIPSRFEELAEFPRLPSGKIDRKALSELPLAERSASRAVAETMDPTERRLGEIWRTLLQRESGPGSDLGLDDNFFEVGGHSLLVVRMADAIEREFGVEVGLTEIFQQPTLRQLAARLGRRPQADLQGFDHLFPLQTEGGDDPLIMAIPHFLSDVLAETCRGERPVYGLRGVGIRPEGNLGRWPTMESLAEQLVDEIERCFDHRRFVLGGYSFGASMAFEAAKVMTRRGLEVSHLLLIAPMPFDFYRLGPLTVQIPDSNKPPSELSPRDVLDRLTRHYRPWSRPLYTALGQKFVVDPWRRILCAFGRLRVAAGMPLTPRIQHADVRIERFRLHRDFDPTPISVPTTFVNPTDSQTDAAATWMPLFEGPLNVIETADPHRGGEALEATRTVVREFLERFSDTERSPGS